MQQLYVLKIYEKIFPNLEEEILGKADRKRDEGSEFLRNSFVVLEVAGN